MFQAPRASQLARLVLLSLGTVAGVTQAQRPSLELRGGRWFDGTRFVHRTVYAINGVFRSARPARVDSIIDLRDSYIVPPFADAHVHNLSDSASLDEDIRTYQSLGVFYLMEMDPGKVLSANVRARVNTPRSVDVQYVQGLMAPSWGVIADMYQMLAKAGEYGTRTALSDLDAREIFLIDTPEDLDRKWPRLLAEHPDLVKVHIDYSEEFAKRRSNPAYGDDPPKWSAKAGIDPALVPLIAQRAHAAGLRLAAHIETAADFRLAVRSGVDIVAHMPASWEIGARTGFHDASLAHWELTDADAELAASHHTIVVTTLAKDSTDPDAATYATVYRHNVAVLAKHRVRLILGSDAHDGSAPTEALYIAHLGVLDRGTLLTLLTETTPRAIFPDRRIGALRDGYEASFLALASNPLQDLAAIRVIRIAVKQGVVLPMMSGGGS